jgi:lipoate-protein ligase A
MHCQPFAAVLRIIVSTPLSAAMNLAIGEAIFNARCNNVVNYDTFRIFCFSKPAVILGNLESINDINLEQCLIRGFEVTMRRTGGGCVMFTPDDIHYEYVGQHKRRPDYDFINNYVLEALEKLGLPEPRIDQQDKTSIKCGDMKISGNAQLFSVSKGALMHHGSILSSVDAEQMLSVLQPTHEQRSLATVGNIKNTICGYKQYNSKLTQLEVKNALINSLTSGKKEDQDYFFGLLTKWEEKEAQALYENKYSRILLCDEKNSKLFGICYLYTGKSSGRNYELVQV